MAEAGIQTADTPPRNARPHRRRHPRRPPQAPHPRARLQKIPDNHRALPARATARPPRLSRTMPGNTGNRACIEQKGRSFA
ncbi:hypothetical protein GCM10027074_22970 [Streptomyces deserti]